MSFARRTGGGDGVFVGYFYLLDELYLSQLLFRRPPRTFRGLVECSTEVGRRAERDEGESGDVVKCEWIEILCYGVVLHRC